MINKVILMGRLTADPELKQTQSGISTCKFSIAINRNYKKDGEEQQADFVNIVTWRQTAEFVCKYFSKGKMIIVEGSLRNNNYTDKNGVKHYSMDVQADNVSFGESKGNTENAGNVARVNESVGGFQQANSKSAPLDDLSDFEEILSDGDVPF